MKLYFKTFGIYLGLGFIVPLLCCIPGPSIGGLFLNHYLIARWLYPLFECAYTFEIVETSAFIIRVLLTSGFALVGMKRFKTGLICEMTTSLINVGAIILTTMKYG